MFRLRNFDEHQKVDTECLKANFSTNSARQEQRGARQCSKRESTIYRLFARFVMASCRASHRFSSKQPRARKPGSKPLLNEIQSRVRWTLSLNHRMHKRHLIFLALCLCRTTTLMSPINCLELATPSSTLEPNIL